MIRTSSLLFLSFLCTLFLVCSVPVLADEDYTFGGKGLVDYVKDYFSKNEVESIPAPDVSVIGEPEEASSGVALMSVSPEDIANGVLTFDYNSFLDHNHINVGYTSVNSSSAMNSVRTSGLSNELDDEDPVTYTDTISITSDSVIVDKGEIFDFSLTGITNWWDYKKTTNSGSSVFDCLCEDASKIDVSVYFIYHNGNKVKAEVNELIFTVDSTGKYYYLSVSITEPLSYDIYGIDIEMKYDVTVAFGMPGNAARCQSTQYADYWPHHTIGFYNSEFVLSIIDQTNGLLGGIIDWLKGIWEGITSLPGKIVDGIKNLMISLFVPDDEFFEETFEKFDDFLSEKLGFLYTSFSYILDLFKNLVSYWDSSNTVQETITFPEVSIPLPNDVEFVFGGWEVDIIPDGFEEFVDILKFFVNMICTIYMIKTSWHYFEKILGTPSSSVAGR